MGFRALLDGRGCEANSAGAQRPFHPTGTAPISTLRLGRQHLVEVPSNKVVQSWLPQWQVVDDEMTVESRRAR